MKLSIIGASGSIGLEITKMSLFGILPRISSLCLFYHSDNGKKKIIGMINDVLVGNTTDNIKVTSNINDLTDTDICILCAGKAVDTNIKEIANSDFKVENNRDILYEYNKNITLYWVKQIHTYSPKALVILVTNPVSKLLTAIYNRYPNLKAVGCGITNDTLRVRNEFIKSYSNNLADNLFIIGEHNLSCQTIALSYFNNFCENKFNRLLFEKNFDSKQEKQTFINNLKNAQNEMLLNNKLEMIENYNASLPIIYKSYMTHRMSHFLFKTHLSTSMAVKEIIEAYVFENKMVSVEVKCKQYLSFRNCILGVPVRFKNKKILLCPINLDKEDNEILLECERKFKLRKEIKK